MTRPPAPIALTCGEPAGIGPELAVATAQILAESPAPGAPAPAFFLIGDPRHLPDGAAWRAISTPNEVYALPKGVLAVLPHDFPAPNTPGQPNPANATGVIAVIERAVALVQAGAASALTTNPIHKKALIDGAGFGYPGHTEFLAALAGVPRVVMMLACAQLRVVPTTIHIALGSVSKALTSELLEETLRITHAGLQRDFAIAAPRLAVAGLNPHAGEGGAMGAEEITLITPLLNRLRAEGMDLSGPLSADTMFHPAARARYDAAVCMYHDQALIPIKTLDFSGGVNVTLGLPFIRTSPDHGTAFDIAGLGQADPSSLIAALYMAQDMAHKRHA